jgi:hypothetical protein
MARIRLVTEMVGAQAGHAATGDRFPRPNFSNDIELATFLSLGLNLRVSVGCL